MNTAKMILDKFGLHPPSTAPGRYYTKCPKCSATRTTAHQKLECLGVTIDEKGVKFGCNHCKFGGGALYLDEKANFIATYDYFDENDKLLFQVCRTADKQFPQRRPDGIGGWTWGTKDVRKVLFHLSEVTEAIANDRAILIVEGEKDVLNLQRIGLVATCNPGGASEPGKKPKWRKEYSETLRGGDVIIIPDHDPAGYAHADAIASISAGLAKSVRVLKLAEHWPDCPKGGDVSDWLAAGHTREQLDALIEHAKPWTCQETTSGKQKANGKGEHADSEQGVSLDDFLAYMPQHSYIFAPSRELWPAASVNARVPSPIGPDGKPMQPSKWLDTNAAVEQMTWAPGKPMLIRDKLIADGGWIDRPGCAVFNLYKPSVITPTAGNVTPWLSLIERLFPDQADHIVSWLAHRVQRPHEKINHALVLGGGPGIGKDTILEPIKRAIGPWNFADVSPKQVLGRFSGFLKSVILRVSEARDLGEFDRYAFHDHMKVYIAAPPDVLRIDEKNIREYYIFNLCGVVITSNHKTDGIYLPADDRRHMVAWSNLTKDDFTAEYWRNLYKWYTDGGDEHVAHYLANLDISTFDPKEPPPKTQAFWEIANANRAPEDAELADTLDDLGRPDVVTLAEVANRAAMLQPAFAEWLRDRKNRRNIPHRFEDCGYVAVSNPHDTEGRWKIAGVRHTIYGKATLTVHDRVAAAFKFTGAR
jgi:hypothetical protein